MNLMGISMAPTNEIPVDGTFQHPTATESLHERSRLHPGATRGNGGVISESMEWSSCAFSVACSQDANLSWRHLRPTSDPSHSQPRQHRQQLLPTTYRTGSTVQSKHIICFNGSTSRHPHTRLDIVPKSNTSIWRSHALMSRSA